MFQVQKSFRTGSRLQKIMPNRHGYISFSLYLTIDHKVVSVALYIISTVYKGRMKNGGKAKWLYSLFKSFSRIPHNKFPFPLTGQNYVPWSPIPYTMLLLSRFSRVRLCATPQTAAQQAPPSLGFSRQEHWSGWPFPCPMHESETWKSSCSVVSNSYRPHGLQPTRLLHPWDFPGKSTGLGCHCLLWPYTINPT